MADEPTTTITTETPVANFYDGFKDPETKEGFPKMFPTIKDPEALAKTAMHAQRQLGQKGTPLPQKPEEVVPWLQTHMGAPKDAAGYKFDTIKIPEPLAKALGDDAKKALPAFGEIFAKAGMTQSQVEPILNAYYAMAEQELVQRTASENLRAQEGIKALQKEWGADFKKNMASAEMALNHLGTPELVAEVQRSGLGNNPAFVKMLTNAAGLMKEDPATGKLSSGGFAAGPEQASQEIDLLFANEEFMKGYNNSNSPQYTVNRERMRVLFETKHGERGRKTK